MSDPARLDEERLVLDRERLRLERQKLALDVAMRRRELSSPSRGTLRELFSNPLALAIVGGFITLITSIVGSAFSAYQNRQVEAVKAEYSRASAQEALQAELIKKFVEGPAATVRENLRFLVDAGLLPTYAERIKAYLRANPQTAPRVPTSGAGPIGGDDAVPVEALPQTDPLTTVSRSVGLLSGDGTRCSAFLIGPATALTSGDCVIQAGAYSIEVNGHRSGVTVIRRGSTDDNRPNYAILRLDRPIPGATGLRLSSRLPRAGEPLSIVLSRGSSAQFAGRGAQCQVTRVDPQRLIHRCATGGGSSGAPVMSADGREVLGIHLGWVPSARAGAQPTEKQASRVDSIPRS